jgi:hypothetical protein
MTVIKMSRLTGLCSMGTYVPDGAPSIEMEHFQSMNLKSSASSLLRSVKTPL